MLSLERYTDLYTRRANGTLDPDSLSAFNELEAAGRTAPLEQLRANATPQLGTSQDRPPIRQSVDPTQLQVGQTPAPPPAFGPTGSELGQLEAQRNPMNIPRSFEAERLEQQMLQRHATTTSPATVTPTSPPPTTTAPPPTTTVPPAAPMPPSAPVMAPPSSAAGAMAAPPAAPAAEPERATTTTPTSQPAYPNTAGAPPPQDGITSKEVMQQIAQEGRADSGAKWADRLNLPAAEMPGGKYEGAERAAAVTDPRTIGPRFLQSMAEHPIQTPLHILGAPMNSVAAAAQEVAQQAGFEGRKPAFIGDVAGLAAGLALPGVPKTGAFRSAPVVRKLERLADTEGRAVAGAASTEATKRLATRGLKVDPRRVMTNFQNHVEAARAAVNPAEMRDSFKRAIAVVEAQWPGAKFAHVEQIKGLLKEMGGLERKINFRNFVTRASRVIGGITGTALLGEMGLKQFGNEIKKARK